MAPPLKIAAPCLNLSVPTHNLVACSLIAAAIAPAPLTTCSTYLPSSPGQKEQQQKTGRVNILPVHWSSIIPNVFPYFFQPHCR